MRALRLLAVAATAAVLAACGSNDPDDDTVLEPGPAGGDESATGAGAALVDTTWTLDKVATSSSDATPEAPATVTITDDGRLEADSGCNTFGGSAEVNGEQITLGDVISTLRACEGATGEIDQAFATVLHGTITAEVSDDVLTLTNDDGESLMFSASS